MASLRDYIKENHKDYDNQLAIWEYHLRSYLGGKEYQEGHYLNKYTLETGAQYDNRLTQTPLDNHCRNIIHIYSSYIWRVPPTRNFGIIEQDPMLESFLKDADLDGRSFDAVMRDAQVHASVYGSVWLFLDKPNLTFETRAEEIDQEIRPYVSLVTPENVTNWKYQRMSTGRYYLSWIRIREEVTKDFTIYREWFEDRILAYKVDEVRNNVELIEEIPNALGKIPFICLYNQRSHKRGIGISDLTDVADIQKAIYNELSEVEQLIRISNHPSLVKTPEVEASAGAGSIVEMPSDMDANLKPYMLQPSGQNLESIMASIREKVSSIDRITHLGSVRATETKSQSGIALQTEFQLLNARLSEKADFLEIAEEQIWKCWAMWQGREFDGVIEYPKAFDLRDWANDLEYLMTARASSVRSDMFKKEVEKQIVSSVLDDDEVIQEAHKEIDSSEPPQLPFALQQPQEEEEEPQEQEVA